jgi:hypothetical protein
VFFVQSKLAWTELSLTGMSVVVEVNLGMAFKTNRNGIFKFIRTPVSALHDVIQLHLDTVKPMTNATSAVTLRK